MMAIISANMCVMQRMGTRCTWPVIAVSAPPAQTVNSALVIAALPNFPTLWLIHGFRGPWREAGRSLSGTRRVYGTHGTNSQ